MRLPVFFSDSDTLGFSYKVGKRGASESTDIMFSDDLFDIIDYLKRVACAQVIRTTAFVIGSCRAGGTQDFLIEQVVYAGAYCDFVLPVIAGIQSEYTITA